MRVIIITVFLLTIILIYILSAGSKILILQTENKNHKDVITWLNSKNSETAPLPVRRTDVLLTKKTISLESLSYFHTGTDEYIGTLDISGDKRKPELQVNWYNLEGDQIGIFREPWHYDFPYPVYRIDPNPFNPSTVIRWRLPVESQVELSIYSISGEKVVTLVSERQTAGRHQIVWDARDVASGVYYYRIQTGKFEDVKKMVLVR